MMSDSGMVAVIAGPSASGKSALALALAERLGGVIINADASQLYADLRVLTARPSEDEEARVPHRLYGMVDGAVAVSAADWADWAKAEVAAALAAGQVPVIVGGTGLYIETLLEGIAPVPEIDEAVRAAVRGLETDEARAALAREDPVMAARVHDRQRVLRALEVVRGTGRSLALWQRLREGGIAQSHEVRGLVVAPPRDVRRAAAARRLEAMMAAGALDEVRALMARGLDPGLPVMKALGVAPLRAHLAGETGLEAAMAATLVATQQYQKRQITWARGRLGHWLWAERPALELILTRFLPNKG
jgi:tRNA dimethylallyltransferase